MTGGRGETRRTAIALLVLLGIGGMVRLDATLLTNGDFGSWTDDSTPASWNVEAHTYARTYQGDRNIPVPTDQSENRAAAQTARGTTRA